MACCVNICQRALIFPSSRSKRSMILLENLTHVPENSSTGNAQQNASFLKTLLTSKLAGRINLTLLHLLLETALPIAYASNDLIAGDKLQAIPNASLFEFGVIISSMYMAWMRTTAGRLKSDYQHSAKITYNNYPWPDVGAACSREQLALKMKHSRLQAAPTIP